MAKGQKYDYRVVQADALWTAEIVRQVTSRKKMVSKRQDGFATEAEAKAWGESQLALFVQSLAERNKRKAKLREERTAAAEQPVADTAQESEEQAESE
ncbi:MAG: DUF3622 domain-containing protein [Pontibacterium sp.]